MTLLFGALGLLAFWWLAGNALRRAPALRARLIKRWAAYAALALAAVFLLRGRLDLALIFGLGGAWAIDGAAGLGARLRGSVERLRSSLPNRTAALVRPLVGAGGRIVDGTVMAGPYAGQSLSSLAPAVLVMLLAGCRPDDRGSARALEAYLDGRHPGWRVDAERDSDPRAGRPADPGAMTQEQAYEILGLERGATLEQIRAAHRALMKRSHPDQGGTVEGAARVNAARDRLTNRHR